MRFAKGLHSIWSVRGIERHIWRRMGAGFAVLIPALVTYLALRFLTDRIDGLMAPLLNALPFTFPGLGLLLVGTALYLLGFAVSVKFGKAVMNAQHAIFSRIPIIGSIYGLTKEATDNLAASSDKRNFRRVVLLEWPRRNVYAVGFVTGNCSLQGESDDRVAVYIPTVPNPTSGMFALVLSSEVIDTDISVEEAVRLVLSGGIVLPDINGGMRPAKPNTDALRPSEVARRRKRRPKRIWTHSAPASEIYQMRFVDAVGEPIGTAVSAATANRADRERHVHPK